MDYWFTWLSKTGLDPSLVYEYALAFTQNELEEQDIPFFNHEFLQSMGISIAKHRLEILKLAQKTQNSKGLNLIKNPISTLLSAIKQTRKNLAKYVREIVHKNQNERALVVVKSNQKNKRKKMRMKKKKEERLMMITDGREDGMMVSTPKLECFSSPMMMMYDVHHHHHDHDDHHHERKMDKDEAYWTPALEEIRWDAMFQDLKPT